VTAFSQLFAVVSTIKLHTRSLSASIAGHTKRQDGGIADALKHAAGITRKQEGGFVESTDDEESWSLTAGKAATDSQSLRLPYRRCSPLLISIQAPIIIESEFVTRLSVVAVLGA
jgi:hypothetical protein